jgi:hypothetical protein
MDMKSLTNKAKVIILLIAVAIIAVAIVFYTKNTASKNTYNSKTLISYSINKDSSTVFDALVEYGKTNNIEIKSSIDSRYGVFVESIGGIKNGDEGKYWQYYINNTLGDVAADKKTINKNDVVEWRFENVPF